MQKVKITVMKIAHYEDLMLQYENPLEHACNMKLGQVFIANGWQKPGGFCDSAWDSLSPFVMTLAYGGEDIYSGRMKDKQAADMCDYDCRCPVRFLIGSM